MIEHSMSALFYTKVCGFWSRVKVCNFVAVFHNGKPVALSAANVQQFYFVHYDKITKLACTAGTNGAEAQKHLSSSRYRVVRP